MPSLWPPLRGIGVLGSTGCPHPFLARPEPTIDKAHGGNGGAPAQQGRREEGSGREGRGGESRAAPLSATPPRAGWPCGGCTASRQAASRRRAGRRGLWRGRNSGDHARPQRGWLPPPWHSLAQSLHEPGAAVQVAPRASGRWRVAAGQSPTASPPAAQAPLASFQPPYASGGRSATRLSRRAAWWASTRPCGGLAEHQRKNATRRVFAAPAPLLPLSFRKGMFPEAICLVFPAPTF
jgi:hypothetical protein